MNKQAKVTQADIPKLIPEHLPEFKGKKLQIERTFGMTNETFKVSAEGTQSIIFRILSPIIDRKYENMVLRRLDSNEICPNTLYACESYRIEEFIESAKHPSTQQINENDKILEKVLKKLYQLHETKLAKELQKSFFDNIVFTPESKKKYENATCHQPHKEAQFKQLKKHLISDFETLHKKIASHFKTKTHSFKLTHNDANNNNIFLRKSKSKKDEELLLIDFEYACYNYVAYDIANLLNECCFDYLEEMPGFKVYKHVNEQEIEKACVLYPVKYEGLAEDVKFMLGVCNYFWALWSLVAKPTPTFSAVEHGKARYDLYKYYMEKLHKH